MRFEEARELSNVYRVDVHDCEPGVTRDQALEASRHIECLPGRAVVACHRPRAKVGALYLPEDMQERFRADLATVVAFGGDYDKRGERLPDEIRPGDVVVTDWQLGKRVWGLDAGPVPIDTEVRFYGLVGGTELDDDGGCEDLGFQAQPWTDGIMAIKDIDGFVPLGDKALFKLPPMEDTTEGGIVLADRARKRSAKWRCVAAGPKADQRIVGRHAVCHTAAMTYIVTDDGVEYAIGKTTGYDAPVFCFVD